MVCYIERAIRALALAGVLAAWGCASSDPSGSEARRDAAAGDDDAFDNADPSDEDDFNAGNPQQPPSRRDGGMPSGGNCGLHCFTNSTGAGGDAPFDLTQNPSDGVGLDPDGALVLARENVTASELIWVANTGDHRPDENIRGTVSKIDTNTFTELGRYAVPGITDQSGDENGPSRTSVDSDGNVYAGARFGNSLTKVSSAGENCPDTNGDGLRRTSMGMNDVLPLGEDDCVIWSTDIGGDARGVAVQEIPTEFIVNPVPDGEPMIEEIPGARYVWVGGRENGSQRLHKLDAETGEILLTLDPPPTPVYGLALDGRGNLWLSSQREEAFGRVDTTRCVDSSCAMETLCVTRCSETSCPDTCDDAVLERIEVFDDDGGQHTNYGVTVDCNQRVWLGGAYGGDGVKRYNPLAPANQRLDILRDVAADGPDGVNGIAADAAGWVWGAALDMGVWRINADTLQYQQVTGTGGGEFSAKGMAVDRRGRVWAIPLRQDYAMVITPGPTIDVATVDKPITGLFDGPYTYSDMTGEQRRLAANEPGHYRELLSGCSESDKPTQWGDLEWDVEAPDGTFVVFLARTADTLEALESAPWFDVAAAPGRESPVEIAPFIAGARQMPGRYLEIEARLFTTVTGSESADGCSSTPALTPRLKSFGVSFSCEPELG